MLSKPLLPLPFLTKSVTSLGGRIRNNPQLGFAGTIAVMLRKEQER